MRQAAELHGDFASHANHALLEKGAEFLKQHSPCLVLAETRQAADDLVRSCCRTPGSALIGVHRHTVRDLVLKLSSAPMAERGLSPISRLAREAIAAEIASRLRGKLTYLAPVSGFPGFARSLGQCRKAGRARKLSVLYCIKLRCRVCVLRRSLDRRCRP
jgi:hypothetical protein